MIKCGGIRWSIHPLFIIVMLASAVTGYFAELLTLFILVLVHELGHVVVAKGFGWTIREVKLLPFGGVAEVDEAGGITAKEDAIVAIAGPLQNVWMGALAWGLGVAGIWDEAWAQYVGQANLMIALFNLLPIYPLDGGKLLQALLSYMMNYYRMLIWSARLSLLFSAMMLLGALFPLIGGEGIQLNLFIVGTFLLVSNWTYHRNIPYLFYRFLTHRSNQAEDVSEQGKTVSPIIVNGKQSVLSVAKLFNRERYHLVYVIGASSTGLQVLPEGRIVDGCLSGLNPHRAVSELFS
ncbi:M50 family metallopeptidase [Paenibacillus paeoniae]|uniref:Zn-dependent protease n=1 Tax=Paenibacillus paeoniae TaxID=2292705 RepID=A0A371PI88_9BACL|nr:M50 family metallopeptidase [Paenibacillus paeoniae]REK75931.1 Zn-dependent protease [Paenibacillus paeoniae]